MDGRMTVPSVDPALEDSLMNVIQALECVRDTTDEGRRRIAKGVWDQVLIALVESRRALAVMRRMGH